MAPVSMEPDDLSIASYRLVRRIGKGSMGTVYEGLDSAGRRLAVKVLAGELASDAELVERFRREAMSAANLVHPNITSVLDFGEEGPKLFSYFMVGAMGALTSVGAKATVQGKSHSKLGGGL